MSILGLERSRIIKLKNKKMKYKLTKNKKEIFGVTLYQIQALKDFRDVKKGEIGGWIEKEKNLEQKGNSWIYENAKVYGDARIFENARIHGNARIFGRAVVCGNSIVSRDSWVFEGVKCADK